MVDEVHILCVRMKLRLNNGESKRLVFEEMKVEACDYNTLYRRGVPESGKCEVALGGKNEGSV